jgi:hypothetical protein
MPEEKRLDLTPIIVRLAAAWVAAGACFKLFAGTPNDLPAVLHDLPLSIDLFFKSAIGIELAIVFAALLRPRQAWLPLVALYVVFDVILVTVLASGEESCGCFGSSIEIAPEVMIALDSVLLIAVLVSQPWRSEAKSLGPLLAVPALALVSLVAPFIIVGTQELPAASGDEGAGIEELRYVIIEPEKWTDQLVYDTQFAALFPDEIESLPTDGHFIFWRQDCDHCAEHLQTLAQANDMSQPIVLIQLEQAHDTEENRVVFSKPTGGHVTELSLPPGPQYVIETPAEFVLEGGMVVSAVEGLHRDG